MQLLNDFLSIVLYNMDLSKCKPSLIDFSWNSSFLRKISPFMNISAAFFCYFREKQFGIC